MEKFVFAAFFLAFLLLAGCISSVDTTPSAQPSALSDADANQGTVANSLPSSETAGWKSISLTDIGTGNSFKVSDFTGKAVVLESFAVWCPVCLEQQKEIKKLKDSEGDSFVAVSVDTDPNEDTARVREHIARNGFGWHYAVSPAEMTQALISEFGLTVVNAPSAPVILVCEDQSARFLRNGVKTAEDLKNEIEAGC
ncbi:MAG: redoxin family protein [Candidatus Diapherotrites archaeon]